VLVQTGEELVPRGPAEGSLGAVWSCGRGAGGGGGWSEAQEAHLRRVRGGRKSGRFVDVVISRR